MLFLPLLLLSGWSAVAVRSEVPQWTSGPVQFRADGICLMNNLPRYFPYVGQLSCGDRLYEAMKSCHKLRFHGLLGDRPSAEFTDAALLILNGCLQCPSGKAEATVRLLNRLPSGPMFSGCDEEEIAVSSVTVKLTASPRDNIGYGTFSLGGILQSRKCSGLFSDDQGQVFTGLVLEVSHSCGRKRKMKLLVRLPPLNVSNLREKKAGIREWDGLSVDLGIFGAGWDERWLSFEVLRPRSDEKPSGGRHQMEEEEREHFPRPMVAAKPAVQQQRKRPPVAENSEADKPAEVLVQQELPDSAGTTQPATAADKEKREQRQQWLLSDLLPSFFSTGLLWFFGILLALCAVCLCLQCCSQVGNASQQ